MSQITDQVEALRQQAIAILIAERQEIDKKLSQMGYDGNEPVKKIKTCSVCGEFSHTARFHKKTPENPGDPAAQTVEP